jgi:hypothetical protein
MSWILRLVEFLWQLAGLFLEIVDSSGAASIKLHACVTVACGGVPIDSGAVSILYRFIHVLL